jgi:hypothetical protein
LLALGVSYPPKSGWIERLIGTGVSDEQYERFLGHSTSKQAEQILRGEQPAKGLQYAKRAKKLASEKEKPQLIWITSTCLKSKSIGSPRLLAAEDLLDTIGETC